MTATASAPALSVRDLSVVLRRGAVDYPVLDSVALDVSRGRTLGIVGESGSGKTATARAIMGLLPKAMHRTGGTVALDGVELTALDDRSLSRLRGARISMVFQEPMTSLNPSMAVGEQIAESVRRHRGVHRRAARARAVEVMNQVGIPDANRRARCYPHEFSGGMRQRVMIAIAIACEPEVLIADEPTTALDVTIQAQVIDLLKRMRDELGLAVVLVTHDLGVVADVCDDVVVMYAGQVVERAPVDELFRHPRHPYTAALLAATPLVGPRRGRLAVIPGAPPGLGEVAAGCRFAARCNHVDDRCRTADVPLVASNGSSVRCARLDEIGVR